jgi:N-hydroxyarylamine O-acetyltransferase
MKLADYLSRIEYQGQPRADLECLSAIHRQHLLHIPYENIDVQMGRRLDLDIERIFDKIVHQHRGGWCYEMNGLLGWALGEIGFDVMRMAGGVMRSLDGDDVLGNHLVLAVQLEQPYIADVGLGNGLIEPAPLEGGPIRQGFRECSFEEIEHGYWRFNNFPGAMPLDFDFRYEAADESLLVASCDKLQSDPESIFLQNLICMRLDPEGARFMVGKMLFVFSGLESKKRTLESEEDLGRTLSEVFNLHDMPVDKLWARVVARHAELFD